MVQHQQVYQHFAIIKSWFVEIWHILFAIYLNKVSERPFINLLILLKFPVWEFIMIIISVVLPDLWVIIKIWQALKPARNSILFKSPETIIADK